MSAMVSIHGGKLEGEEQDGVLVFRGVPFALAPLGARRWLPPEQLAAWSGVRDARRFGPVAPQNPVLLAALAAMKIAGEQSEDCLNLNIWTPAADRRRRPVMVWIHGGGFTIGSGSQPIYDGSVLARRGDTVLVTINYRMGALGFLRLSDLTGGRIPSTGNEAILDQIAALRWVRDNIAEFGGDPENVTLFGESAGAMSVGTLLAMPQARGLFHKAILQSGSCHTAASVERANRVAERLLSKLGVAAADPGAIRALPADRLLKALLLADGRTPDPALGMAYQPVVDGTLLPRPAIEMVAQGSAQGVVVMIGSNLEEWKLFALNDPSLPQLDREGLAKRVSRRLTADFADPLIGAYQKTRAQRGAPTGAPELFSAIETDRVFRMPGVRLAEVQGRREPRLFSYLFTWRSPAMGGALGSCHALELGFVFGTNHLPGMTAFAGAGVAVERIEREIQDAWLGFARAGDPGWPAYTERSRTTMLFGESSGAENAPLEGERRAWDGLPDAMLGAL